MRVLVTGATGFMGQALVPALMAAGTQVRGFGRASPGGLEWHTADLTDVGSVRGACRDCEVVFHLAGIAHTRAAGARHEEVTVAGTRALLAEAQEAGVRQFIFVSSIKAECSDDDYARSRRAAEDWVRGAGFAATAIVRPALVYSAGMRGNLDRLLAVAAGRLPLPIPHGGPLRSLVHKDDLVAVLVALMRLPQASVTYTVSDGHPYTLRGIYDAMRQGFGYRRTSYALPQSVLENLARLGDRISAWTARPCAWDSRALAPLLESCASDDTRVWQDLARTPQYTLASAMPAMVAAYRDARHKPHRRDDRV